jgi:hypothetical protein
MKILITESQLSRIVEQEGQKVGIRKFRYEDLGSIIPHLSEIFHKLHVGDEILWEEVSRLYNPDLSAVLTLDDRVIGFYFIGDMQIPDTGNPLYDELKDLRGVMGISLGILPKYKELGLGKKLINWSQRLPVDYIWGGQEKSLNNINDWRKRREIYYDGPDFYLTFQMLNGNVLNRGKNLVGMDMDEMGREINFSFISEFN